ncbi:lytic transglycosylase domain-containing protein [Polaromonas glacialis]|uniref:lytic transglycosylase domain-containing protein n=1 Tax=Polaromonas glacialis TaxID=866564 RepID=UPI000496B405|nr:lytic transglycosylase domain-containing protein [Polaromonas glacialis]
MTALVNNRPDFNVKDLFKNVRSGLGTVADDIARGFFVITHSSFALLGLVVAFAVVTLMARPDLRDTGEVKLMAWLQERRAIVVEPESFTPRETVVVVAERPVADKPKALSSQQAAVASWISKKYSVAQEPVGTLVAEAFEIGHNVKLDPTLILAIMAIESGFNPFAQSPVGAQGLMQVMTQVHHDKYAKIGGRLAAFDPVANLRVGVKVLQECITRAGSIEGGLKYYVGAANLESDGGYASKVMAERARLLAVVGGKRPPTTTPRFVAASAPAQTTSVSFPAETQRQSSDRKPSQDVAQLDQS